MGRLLDLPSAARLYWGGFEVERLYRGPIGLWERPVEGGDIAFPAALFTVYGQCFDPYHPGNLVAAGGAAATVGGAVGLVPALGYMVDYGGTTRGPNLAQATSGYRPTLIETEGRRGFAFDGADDRLEATSVTRFEPAFHHTAFAMVHLSSATGGVGFCHSRAEASGSYYAMIAAEAATRQLQPTLRHASTAFVTNTLDVSALGGWRLVWIEYDLTAYGADGGAWRAWIDGVLVRDSLVTPAKSAASNVSIFTRTTLGCRRNGGVYDNFWNSYLGRCGSIDRLFSPSERATVEAWARGASWVAP
ncbi:MAG: hypothetical protein ABTQ27_09065 [Amaricoccus sp.]|mgnify:CR=1 FL=1|uniref:hypothetical protein n=1 Tax=Amaricoccus sp. TaxID=1872485 RepID=UPI003314DBEB